MTRRFQTSQLPNGLLFELADLARRAPSAGFSQGTHFVLLEHADLETFWQVSGAGEWFRDRQPGVLAAPAVVVAVADPAAYADRYSATDKAGHGLEAAAGWDVPFWIADTAMATQQLLLLIEDRGLGALYFGVFRNRDQVAALLGLPDSSVTVGAVAVGYRAASDVASGTPIRRPRLPAEQVVHRGRWLR
mgnify:CR=1 FL=1